MEERKRWNKANKLRVSKSETVRDMIVVMDESLVMPDGPLASVADTLRTRLQEKGATFSTGPACNPPLIQWRRKVRARLDASGQSWVPLPREEIDEEKTVLLYLTAKELVQHAQDKTLLTMVQTLRDGLSPTHQIFIMVRGLDAHFRKQQNAANRAYTAAVRNSLLEEGAEGPKDGTMPSSVAGAGAAPQPGTMSKEQIETELIRLKVAERCFVVQVSGLVDAVEWILSVTADISIRPYK